MVHELGARAAGLGLILEAILHEGDLVLVPLREALLEALDGGDILGHLDADEERVGPKHLHQPGRQVAEAPHDVEELVNVRLPREEGRARCHLRQHAADGPNVHRLAVRRVTGEQLGATVPARRDVVGVTRAGARERAREPKVAKLQRAVARDQQVLWFDVTMDHVVGVAVFDRAQQLPQAPEGAGSRGTMRQVVVRGAWPKREMGAGRALAASGVAALLGLERIHAIRVPLEVLENRPLNKLKDEVQLALAPEYLNQVDDVIVFKLLPRRTREIWFVSRSACKMEPALAPADGPTSSRHRS
eukprot:scaffold35192_cov129-Isochrysis_galbana.AAC.3